MSLYDFTKAKLEIIHSLTPPQHEGFFKETADKIFDYLNELGKEIQKSVRDLNKLMNIDFIYEVGVEFYVSRYCFTSGCGHYKAEVSTRISSDAEKILDELESISQLFKSEKYNVEGFVFLTIKAQEIDLSYTPMLREYLKLESVIRG